MWLALVLCFLAIEFRFICLKKKRKEKKRKNIGFNVGNYFLFFLKTNKTGFHCHKRKIQGHQPQVAWW